jgi:hypothetical protein
MRTTPGKLPGKRFLKFFREFMSLEKYKELMTI